MDVMRRKRNLFKYSYHRVLAEIGLRFDHPYITLPPSMRESKILGTLARAYGIDISHWEGAFNPDKAQPGLLDFVIFKASEGTTYRDDWFERNYAASVGKVPILGAYHYLRSGYSTGLQVENFLGAVAGKQLQVLVCDFEAINNTMDDNFVVKAADFGKAVKAAHPGAKLLFYTNPSNYDDYVHPGSLRKYGRDVFLESPWDGFWIAQYYYAPSPDKFPSMPKTRSDWVFWQYSEAGDPAIHGTDGWADQNVYNGNLSQLTTWIGASVPPVDPPEPPPDNGGEMQPKVFSNGVTVIAGDLHDSNVRTVIIPYASMRMAGFAYSAGKCVQAESLDGFDFVANFTPFNVLTCRVNLGLRANGLPYEDYHNYNPYLVLDGKPFISHVARQFKNYKTVSQGFRYLVENGFKNHNANSDWDEKAARRLVGTKPNGDLVIITVAPVSYPGGWDLHQAAEYGISLGCDMLIDGDSGRSTQDYLLINGSKDVFWGTPYHDSAPAFLTVKFW
ncbi:MAG TPA: GH25 family lysozyme, partial [Anaerolineales bacterium]|nr:GH25 family lysozyme [Anaerolineales bacterium]